MKQIPLYVLAFCATALVLSGCGHSGGKLADSDDWEVAVMQGQRIGHSHTTVRLAESERRQVVKVEQSMQVNIKRFGDVTPMTSDCSDTETPNGGLIDFQSTLSLGTTPMRTTGKVAGNRLELQVQSEGKTRTHSVDWPADAGGFLAPVLSLRTAPLKPGEHRTIKHLNFDGQVFITELTAQKEETVDTWNGNALLLRVEMVDRADSALRDPRQDIKSTVWLNSSGEAVKTWNEQLKIAFFRVSPEVALAPTAASFDLGKNTAVHVDQPIRRPHDTKWVRYRIQLDGGDAATAFPAGPSQEVQRIDNHTAEVTVRAVRPVGVANTPASDAPKDDDLKPNSFIQSDDLTIVAQAKRAIGGETDPWKQAVALEAYVDRAMTVTDYSQAFATAAEAAQSGKGDCKAHAVYLAALARATKIPARVVVGLVYMPQSQAFGGHMWTEVYVAGHWIGMDATLGKGGIGGGHLQLAHSSMSDMAAYNVFLPVLQVIGRLKIEVVDCE